MSFAGIDARIACHPKDPAGRIDGGARGLVIVIVRLALEQRREEPGFADRRGTIATAALFDIGAGEFIALEWHAVGRDMHGAPVGEYLGELIVGHPRPVTDAASVEMDEWRA